MKGSWLQQPERGSKSLVRLIAWLSLRVGRGVGRFLLIPICVYYLILAGSARRASRQYLTIALDKSVSLIDTFRHMHTFASTILDRVFFVTDRFEGYELTFSGLPDLEHHLARKTGCILLSAHVGSFDALRSFGILRKDLPIKVLMHAGHSGRLNDVLAKLNPRIAEAVIPLGSPTSMIEVKECLEAGGLVGMLGDRAIRGERLVETQFFGRPICIPAGPYLLADALKAPIVLFFALYLGNRRYAIHFESFADRLDIDRRDRDAVAQRLADRFAGRMEHYCRTAPYNWFNFYDYWESGRRAG